MCGSMFACEAEVTLSIFFFGINYASVQLGPWTKGCDVVRQRVNLGFLLSGNCHHLPSTSTATEAGDDLSSPYRLRLLIDPRLVL